MKNKDETMDLTLIDSGSYENFNMPDYPDYPDCDDIYNTHLERNEIDPPKKNNNQIVPTSIKKT